MARYQGVRKNEREKLNRWVWCPGDATGYTRVGMSAESALSYAVERLEKETRRMDLRRAESQRHVAFINRLRTLRRELSR